MSGSFFVLQGFSGAVIFVFAPWLPFQGLLVSILEFYSLLKLKFPKFAALNFNACPDP
jgi:hypothetical protein